MAYLSKEKQREYAKRHYEKNKAIYKERAAKFKKVALKRNREFVYEYLLEHSCVDCSENNPILLEFDHDKTKEKSGNIADLVKNGVSINRLKAEICKCNVRCVKCHRIKTAREENWWIYRHAMQVIR